MEHQCPFLLFNSLKLIVIDSFNIAFGQRPEGRAAVSQSATVVAIPFCWTWFQCMEVDGSCRLLVAAIRFINCWSPWADIQWSSQKRQVSSSAYANVEFVIYYPDSRWAVVSFLLRLHKAAFQQQAFTAHFAAATRSDRRGQWESNVHNTTSIGMYSVMWFSWTEGLLMGTVFHQQLWCLFSPQWILLIIEVKVVWLFK